MKATVLFLCALLFLPNVVGVDPDGTDPVGDERVWVDPLFFQNTATSDEAGAQCDAPAVDMVWTGDTYNATTLTVYLNVTDLSAPVTCPYLAEVMDARSWKGILQMFSLADPYFYLLVEWTQVDYTTDPVPTIEMTLQDGNGYAWPCVTTFVHGRNTNSLWLSMPLQGNATCESGTVAYDLHGNSYGLNSITQAEGVLTVDGVPPAQPARYEADDTAIGAYFPIV